MHLLRQTMQKLAPRRRLATAIRLAAGVCRSHPFSFVAFSFATTPTDRWLGRSARRLALLAVCSNLSPETFGGSVCRHSERKVRPQPLGTRADERGFQRAQHPSS